MSTRKSATGTHSGPHSGTLAVRPSDTVMVLLPGLAVLAAAATVAAPAARAAEPYKMSDKELKLDCKKLAGTVKVRILALRQKPIAPTTLVARGIQTVAKPIFGGTSYGTDQDAQRAADLQLVEAYNKRLVEKNCPSFDLAASLAPGTTEAPRPTIPAAGKAAAKPAAPTKP